MNKNILKNNKKVVIIGFVVFVLLSAMYFIYSQENEVKAPDKNDNTNSEDIINDADNSEVKENDNVENEDSIDDTNNEVDENNPGVEPKIDKAEQEAKYFEYLNEGLKYKSEGDAGNKDSYYKSIEAYQKASDVAEGKVWIPYLNLGNVYRLVADFKNAEKSYDKALEITSESTVYKAKIDMYRYELKKSEDEMVVIYEEAIEKVVDNVDLVKNYAVYLSNIGKYSESLEYWKMISEKFPDEQMYKDEIAELETILK